jgi:two-component system, sensor histidine kinase and response regulator
MIPSDQNPQWQDTLPITMNDMFAMVAEHTQNAAIVTDPAYRILWANASFSRITGYTLAEARGRSPADFMRCPDSDPAAGEEIREAVAAGRDFRVTLRNRRKDESRYWIRIEGQPIRAETGKLVAYLVVGSDVTRQVEREIALRRNENVFNEAQRIAHIGSWEYDPATGVCQWSAETFRIYGLPPSKDALDVPNGLLAYVEAHRPLLEAAFTQCVKMGVPFDVEAQLVQPGGRAIWVRSIGHAETEDGRVVRVTGVIQDIDDRKRATLEITRLAERMTLAAKFAGIGIWELNHDTGELIWDDAMLALHGMHRDAFTGDFSIWGLVMLPEDRAAEAQMRDAVTEGRGEFEVEYRIRTPGDEIRYIRNCGRIVRETGGRTLRSYGVNYDITRERMNMIALLESDESLRKANASLHQTIEQTRQLANAAEAANRSKSAFLATISHEIRTPLNGVIGMTNILANTPLNDEQRDYLHTLKLSAESLLTLINDTLDYSKIEAGRVELERQPFDLATCVRESLDLIEPHARQKNLSLSLLLAADLPRTIEGDASRLRQILVNLLGNAVKFTERGGILLEARVESTSGDDVTLVFGITDTGIGIPKDKQARLFEHFFQVDASITRSHGGTGLGLAISRRLVELMGGGIHVESELGRGSTFSVSINATIVIEDALLHYETCLSRLRERRLAVVAEPADAAPLADYARRAGMRCVIVPDASALFERLKAGESFDMVVGDTRIRGLDGVGLARELQARGLPALPLLTVRRIGTLDGASAARYYQLLASLLPVAQPKPRPVLSATSRNFAADAPLSILMAEDNHVNQRVAQLTLRRLGYEIETVSDGAEALGALQRRNFDVVLMDVQMPGMDGLEATRRIRGLSAYETRPWIIALTAGAFEEDRLNAFRAGMNDFLSKPLRIDQLQEALLRASQALQTLAVDTRA